MLLYYHRLLHQEAANKIHTNIQR